MVNAPTIALAKPVKNVLLIHGYSVRTLNSWGKLPQLLIGDTFHPSDIYFSAFVSLDDYVTCDDLALALEKRIAALEASGVDLRETAIIAHSTGAIIARRWMLNRRSTSGNLPSHFISCAGANHGSSLSQLGRTELAYAFRALSENTPVGKRVLADLDYGSDFLRKLNRQWFENWNDAARPLYAETFTFSMGGTDHSFWQNHLTWQSREAGSDGTVRISGANLNYRLIDVIAPYEELHVRTMDQPCPHLVVETKTQKYSHTNQSAPDTLGLVLSGAAGIANEIKHFGVPVETASASARGILEGVAAVNERPYQALREAFAVTDVTSYQALAAAWARETLLWTIANPDEANATIVVSIQDELERVVDDSLVLLQDDAGSIGGVAQSLLSNQPMRNEVSPSVMSFYVNAKAFADVHPHKIHAEARTDTPFISYGFSIDGQLSGGTDHTIAPNETTYVSVVVQRDPSEAFAFYAASDPNLVAILDLPYPPFPKINGVVP